jgi:hypothetical protein
MNRVGGWIMCRLVVVLMNDAIHPLPLMLPRGRGYDSEGAVALVGACFPKPG